MIVKKPNLVLQWMTYFKSDELADCIRHVFMVEDNTGLCCKALPRPRRRPKSGGLLIDLQASVDSDSENEEQYSPNYMPDLDEPVQSTSAAIHHRLLCKIRAIEEQRRFRCAEQKSPADHSNRAELFCFKDVLGAEDSFIAPTTSMASRLILNAAFTPVGQFDEYAKFEALEASPSSRTMTIVFPFCQPKPCGIPINVSSSATLSELIGLSCYVYTREGRQPPCEDPALYSLYLAEENLEYDTELPPQDRHRRVAECGFPVLALVKNLDVLQHQQKSHHCITVYLTNGKSMTFELESLDIPLQWLFDEAMERKRSDDEANHQRRNTEYFRELEYILEAVEQKHVALKLSNTISSTGCTEFILLRRNSSRGELFLGNGVSCRTLSLRHCRSNYELQSPSSSTVGGHHHHHHYHQEHVGSGGGVIVSSSKQSTPGFNSTSQNFDFMVNNSDRQAFLDNGTTPAYGSSELSSGLCGPIIEEYFVDRLHRIKPKWPAKLVVRQDGIEIVPTQALEQRRKTFVPQPTQKKSQIFWELIASVEVLHSDRSSSRRLRINWLQVPEYYQHVFVANHPRKHGHQCGGDGGFQGAESLNDQSTVDEQLIQAYELSTWKILQIEAGSEEVWRMGTKLTSVLDSRNTPVTHAYQHSQGGTRRPAAAAALALNITSFSTATTAASSTAVSMAALRNTGDCSNQTPFIMTTTNYKRELSNESTHDSHRRVSSTAAAAERTIALKPPSTGAKSGDHHRRKISMRNAGAVLSWMLSKQD